MSQVVYYLENHSGHEEYYIGPEVEEFDKKLYLGFTEKYNNEISKLNPPLKTTTEIMDLYAALNQDSLGWNTYEEENYQRTKDIVYTATTETLKELGLQKAGLVDVEWVLDTISRQKRFNLKWNTETD